MNDEQMLWARMSYRGRMRWMRKFRGGGVAGGRADQQTFQQLVKHNPPDADMYIGLNGDVSPKPRVLASDIECWRYVCVDIDPVGDGDEPPLMADILGEWWQGAIVCYSGRGYQAWLPIGHITMTGDGADPQRRTAQFLRELQQQNASNHWAIDSCVSDLPRVVRCPDTINTKTGSRAIVYSWGDEDQSKALQDKLLAYKLDELPIPERLDINLMNLDDLLPHLNVTSRRFLLRGVDSPGRHSACYSTVKDLHDRGAAREVAESWTVAGAAKCLPPLPHGDTARIIKQIYGGN